MTEQPTLFGTELRRLRHEAGLSLTGLAGRVHYSKGYLSKVENGHKPPPPELARLCDAALDAGGELAALVPAQPPGELPSQPNDDGEVWLMNLAPDGTGWFRPLDRRQVLAGGAASVLGFGLGGRGAHASGTSLEAFRELFGQFRQLGQTASPGAVLPALTAQTHTLRQLASRAGESDRGPLLTLAARYAEYAGWMAQESGDERGALWWTDRAVDMAEAGGDHDLAAYSLVRRALITFYRDDAPQTIELARRAQEGSVPPRVRGLAAQQEAQGHALAGDHLSCMRALERARELLDAATPTPDALVLGTTNVADPAAMAAGWCLHDLGRPREAAEVLDRELASLPTTALRSQARYGVRHALAHAAAGEVDRACELIGKLLGVVDAVGSATITTDLRRLARLLGRFHTATSVRELRARLTASLHAP